MTRRYYGSKIVTAWKAENKGEPGYSVKYADGYTSWSPKKQFEDAYIALGQTESLPGWQERIVAEMMQLEDRINKLTAYLTNQTLTEKLEPVALDLLHEQLTIMTEYVAILRLRCSIHGVFKVWRGPEKD